MKENEIIKGFRVIAARNVDEIKATAYEMVHEKTLAKLIWLKRDDDNKTFAITFKTIPENSTGVFHILEHSVLNGSEKFPLKEPFVDLLKGSLQTFLNAMTYSDKTVYPIASRNEQDFINLMRVYLDGVFNPMVKKNPNIFYQEGWHYELNSKEKPIEIKGVVYNEMKGAFSSPERIAPQKLQTRLFPNNSYAHVSGGDPEVIPTLTYEEFCNAHDKYYNPTNSYIWLDGEMDIEKILGIIDEEFLSKFEKREDNAELEYQKPIQQDVYCTKYAVPAESDLNNKTFISKGYVIGNYTEAEKILALNIIGSILTESNRSPLKKAIIEKGLAQDLEMGVNDGILQPYVEIDVYNSNLENYEEIETTIREVLENETNRGLNKEEIIAYLNKLEFSTKERDFGAAPKGLIFGLTALNNWLYGGDPVKALISDDIFKSLRSKVNTTYYDDLIKECILDSKHCATVIAEPDSALEQKQAQGLSDKLNMYKESLSDDEIEKLIRFNEQLASWQAKEDSDEVKAMLPKLSLSDVSDEPSKIEYDVKKIKGIDTIVYGNETDGINYQQMYFNIDDKSKEELQAITLLIRVMPELSSKNYDALTFSRLRKTYIGSTQTALSINPIYKSSKYNTYVSVIYSCLEENDEKALELIHEYMYNLNFDDKGEIYNVLQQEKSSMEMMISGRGNSIGISRVLAMLSEPSAVKEYMSGYDFYQYLKETINNFNDETVEKLENAYKSLFTTNRLTMAVMGPSREKTAENLIAMITPSEEKKVPVEKPLLSKKREGIVVAAPVAYAEMGNINFEKVSEYEGQLMVVNKILSLDYLWTNVRAMGGAYGCGSTATRNGCVACYSYRDPNPANTLDVYAKIPEYLRNLCNNDIDLTTYIIGTIGDNDPLLTNSTIMMIGNAEYLTKITHEDKKNIRKRILETTKEDILEIADIFEKANDDCAICVVGGKQLLDTLNLEAMHQL